MGGRVTYYTNPCQYPLGRHYQRTCTLHPMLTVCMFNTRSRVTPFQVSIHARPAISRPAGFDYQTSTRSSLMYPHVDYCVSFKTLPSLLPQTHRSASSPLLLPHHETRGTSQHEHEKEIENRR